MYEQLVELASRQVHDFYQFSVEELAAEAAVAADRRGLKGFNLALIVAMCAEAYQSLSTL